jgi:poly-gamma-glutamate synthesis protein (capsule biosynthesis protein)
VRLVDRFGADDRESMRHDSTSAFNCRYVAGTTRWSQNAYGRAVDINPVENPYVDGTHVSPRRGR